MQFKTKFLKNTELRQKLKIAYPNMDTLWKKKFAWLPTWVEQRIVWLEFYETRINPYNLHYGYEWRDITYEDRLSQS